jgi:hypothetical protein
VTEAHSWTVAYSIFCTCWSTLFIKTWQRRQHELGFLWGTNGGQNAVLSEPRRKFNGRIEVNAVTGKQTLVYKSSLLHLMKQIFGFSVCSLFMICTVLLAFMSYVLRYKSEDCGAPDNAWCQDETDAMRLDYTSGLANLAVIIVAGKIYGILADQLNDFENHRTHTEHERALVVKKFLFEFFNNYFVSNQKHHLHTTHFAICKSTVNVNHESRRLLQVLFYAAYGREVPDPLTGKPHACRENDCLKEVGFQLMVVFTVKAIGKRISMFIQMVVKNKLRKTRKTQAAQRLYNNIEKDGLKLVPGMLHMLKEASSEAEEGIMLDIKDVVVKAKDIAKGDKITPAEIEAGLEPNDSGGTFDDFNERIIEYGYLVLFASAYPLAPVLAFAFNIFEVRSDAFEMVRGYQRPRWTHCENIGAWLYIMEVVGIVGVITNASLMIFVTPWQAQTLELDAIGFLERLDEVELWRYFCYITISVSAWRMTLTMVSPIKPGWVTEARESLEYRIHHIYRTQKDQQIHVDHSIGFITKMNFKRKMIFTELSAKTTAEVKKIFHEVDLDLTGSLNVGELPEFLLKLNVILQRDELLSAILEMTTHTPT